MKKLYFFLVALMVGLTVNAADFYLRGSMNGWGTEAAWQFTHVSGDDYVIQNVTIPGGSQFKVGSADWSTVNFGGVTDMVANTEYELISGSNVNCSVEDNFTGNVKFNLATGKFKLEGQSTAVDPTTAKIYIRGGMNSWAAEDAWLFTTTDGNNFVLNNVTIEAGVEFKVADASWGAVNYGGVSDMVVNTSYELDFNSADNCTLAADFTGNVEFVLDTHTITFKAEGATPGYTSYYVGLVGISGKWIGYTDEVQSNAEGICTWKLEGETNHYVAFRVWDGSQEYYIIPTGEGENGVEINNVNWNEGTATAKADDGKADRMNKSFKIGDLIYCAAGCTLNLDLATNKVQYIPAEPYTFHVDFQAPEGWTNVWAHVWGNSVGGDIEFTKLNPGRADTGVWSAKTTLGGKPGGICFFTKAEDGSWAEQTADAPDGFQDDNLYVAGNKVDGKYQVTVDETTTGIEAIGADSVAPVYYNMQGVRVDNPQSGLYIMVRGNKVSKVLVK